MSNTIPPLLSNSPPPIIDSLDDYDNDDFGDFNSAGDSSFDFDVLSFSCNLPQLSESVIESTLGESNSIDISNESHKSNENLCISSTEEQDIAGDLQKNAKLNESSDIQDQTAVENSHKIMVEKDKMEECFPQNFIHNVEPYFNSHHFQNKICDNEFKCEINSSSQEFNFSEKKESIQLTKPNYNNDGEKSNGSINEYEISSKKLQEIYKNDKLHDSIFSESVSDNFGNIEDILVNNQKEYKEEFNFSENVPKNTEEQLENNVEMSCSFSESRPIILENVLLNKTKDESSNVSLNNTTSETNEQIEKLNLLIDSSKESLEDENIFSEFIDNSFKNNLLKSQVEETYSEEDDDFTNFNDHNSLYTKSEENKLDDDDFDDFADFSSANSLSNTTSLENSAFSVVTPKISEIEAIIKDFFPAENANSYEFNDNFDEKQDTILKQVRDITETKALTYKWSKSSSQNFLFKALNIDMRNILYGPRWNETVPPFAATLDFTPLEPLKPESILPQQIQEISTEACSNQVNENIPKKETTDEIPTAQFDWNLAGLTNPLDSPCKTAHDLKLNELSNVGEKVPSKINDNISVKSLNLCEVPMDFESLGQLNDKFDVKSADDEFGDFEEFTSFQRPVIDEIGEIPLRETYILNEISTIPKPVKISPGKEIDLQVPTLPNFESVTKEIANDSSSQNYDDDFDDFKTSLPTTFSNMKVSESEPCRSMKISTQNEIFPSVNITSQPIIEPQTLTPSQATSNYTLLQPLQPTPANIDVAVAPKIEWPDPGITANDLESLELNYKPKIFVEKEKSTQDTLVNKVDKIRSKDEVEKKQVTLSKEKPDDDWSDFISSSSLKKDNVNPNLTLGVQEKPKAVLQLSISQLNQLQPPKKPTPVITHQGLFMTGSHHQTPFSLPGTTSLSPQTKRQNYPSPIPSFSNFQQPSLISNQYAKQVEILAYNHQGSQNMYQGSSINHNQQSLSNVAPTQSNTTNDDDEWSDFVSSRPVVPQVATNGWSLRQTNWPTNATPNIITNPVSFDSLPNFTTGGARSKSGNPMNNSHMSSVPELDFVMPKSRTWKK